MAQTTWDWGMPAPTVPEEPGPPAPEPEPEPEPPAQETEFIPPAEPAGGDAWDYWPTLSPKEWKRLKKEKKKKELTNEAARLCSPPAPDEETHPIMDRGFE